MITFQKELFGNIMHELPELLFFHHREICDDKLDFDWDTYAALEMTGRLVIMTARLDGILIGYVTGVLNRAWHSKQTLNGVVDLWYVMPEHRKTGAGFKLLTEIKKIFKEIGVREIFVRIPEASKIPFLPANLGYKLIAKQYSQKL